MKHKYLLAFLVALSTAAQSQTLQPAPRLVVNIIIDQLRTDYLEAYSGLYGDEGFKKLLNEGVVYSNASLPFFPIDRASAIASISTGTSPYYNGITSNKWLDRNTLIPVMCVDDLNPTPDNIVSSTLGDELKISTNGKASIFSVAQYIDAAVLSAGHAADGALWIGKDNKWRSSDYYFKSTPSWIKSYNDISPSEALKSRKDYEINKEITDMALQCIKCNAMGSDNITDILYINYSAGNKNNDKTVSVKSDLQDIYIGLDKEFTRLISTIETNIGVSNVLFVVTSTGYHDEENVSDYKDYKVPTGIFYINRTANLLNMFLGAVYGQGRYIEKCFKNQIFLNQKLIEQKRLSISDVLNRCQSFLIQNAGVRDVYTSELLLNSRSDDLEKIRRGYNPTFCGDIIIEVAPGWQLQNEESNEKYVFRANFIPFPLIIYGANIKPEKINTPVTIDRIAPTIAKAIRIRAPNACKEPPLF